MGVDGWISVFTNELLRVVFGSLCDHIGKGLAVRGGPVGVALLCFLRGPDYRQFHKIAHGDCRRWLVAFGGVHRIVRFHGSGIKLSGRQAERPQKIGFRGSLGSGFQNLRFAPPAPKRREWCFAGKPNGARDWQTCPKPGPRRHDASEP